jgi:hypothetical protein
MRQFSKITIFLTSHNIRNILITSKNKAHAYCTSSITIFDEIKNEADRGQPRFFYCLDRWRYDFSSVLLELRSPS